MIRYKKYKPSGIQWIGDIPEYWDLLRLKYISDIVTGDKDTVDRDDNGEYPFFVRSKKIERISTFSFNGEAILTAGDGDIGKIFHYITGKFDFHQRVYKISNFKGIIGKFLFYFMQSNFYYEVIRISAKSTVDSLRLPMLQNFYSLIPNNHEQTAIANYLDKKTAQIDELISKKEQLLRLYEEEKTAIINQAVTKGLDTKVKLKDSRIEWLGEIPEHWVIRRLATIGKFSKGKGIPRSELKEDGCPAILYGDIYTKYNIKVDIILNHISYDTALSSIKIQNGILMFTGSGETKEDIGKCIVYLGYGDVYAGGDVIIFKQKQCDSLFLSYSLNSHASVYQKARTSKGEIIIHIYSSDLRDLVLVLPEIEEQVSIVKYIKTETARIDAKSEKTKKLIELLKEYRTALISEAVTGKIKVS
ncbi:MAG: restriction endonuclease subunit S [Bacteroidetes bacterium]|nr:restriction endonuclease subunit S [Bacteroidota bacterium]